MNQPIRNFGKSGDLSHPIKHYLSAGKIFNSISYAIAIINERGIFTYANNAFSNICGLSKERVLNKSLKFWLTALEVNQADLFNFEMKMAENYGTSFELILRRSTQAFGMSYIRCIMDPVQDFEKNGKWYICTLSRADDSSAINPDDHNKPSTCNEINNLKMAIESFRTLLKTRWWNPQSLCRNAVVPLARFFKAPVAGILLTNNNRIEYGVSYQNGKIIDERGGHLQNIPGAVFQSKTSSLSINYGRLISGSEKYSCPTSGDIHSLFGIPLLDSFHHVAGAIFVATSEEHFYDNVEIDALEILAWYIVTALGKNNPVEQNCDFEKNPEKIAFFNSFFTGLAHEVRNPLNGIIALNESLRREIGQDESYTRMFDLIHEQAQRLSSLTQQLVLLAEPIKLKQICFSELLDHCNCIADSWKNNHIEHDLSLIVLKPEYEYKSCCMIDHDCITKVIISLLDNAIFNSADNCRILIDLGETSSKIFIRVVDNGSGLKPEAKDRIFDPFFTTHKKKNGLGLSIVKNLIERHGGSIQVENNRYSPGCTAEILLPIISSLN
jgi:signal transduction histidine kinase